MKRKRKHIPMREIAAAALSIMLPQKERDALRSQLRNAKAVISRFEMHHNILHAHGGTDTWENLTPMLKADHRATVPRDIKIIAKTKRIDRDEDKWRQFMRPNNRKEKARKRRCKCGRPLKAYSIKWRKNVADKDHDLCYKCYQAEHSRVYNEPTQKWRTR
jgi:hypothetical protein